MIIYVFGNVFIKGDDAVFPIVDQLTPFFPEITFFHTHHLKQLGS